MRGNTLLYGLNISVDASINGNFSKNAVLPAKFFSLLQRPEKWPVFFRFWGQASHLACWRLFFHQKKKVSLGLYSFYLDPVGHNCHKLCRCDSSEIIWRFEEPLSLYGSLLGFNFVVPHGIHDDPWGRHMDPIYGLLVATHVLSSIFASLHLPTMLRSLMFLPSEWAPEPLLSELHTNQWSKLGAIVIFIASGDLLWLAIYGISTISLGFWDVNFAGSVSGTCQQHLSLTWSHRWYMMLLCSMIYDHYLLFSWEFILINSETCTRTHTRIAMKFAFIIYIDGFVWN